METTQTLAQLAFTYFLVINPLGNSPLILALLKNYDPSQQRRIILREGCFGFALALVFQFFGQGFLSLLGIDLLALTFCGGIILFLLALQMIFPTGEAENKTQKPLQEPFFVPIATPLLVGPGSLSIVMLTAAADPDIIKTTAAITLACIAMIAVTTSAPMLQRLIGKTGMAALGHISGLILVLMSTEMLLNGVSLFIKRL